MPNKNKKILVTGGLGYIGSHTVVELLNAGYDCLIIDNLSNSRIEVFSAIEEITGKTPDFLNLNLCDVQTFRDSLSMHTSIDAVIHFAGFKAVGESIEKPLKYYQNNLNSTLNTLEAMQDLGINNFVFSSSANVYGETKDLPVNEESPIKKPTNSYGKTKQMCEEFIQDLAISDSNFNSIILRYFNPIGAHASAKIGELPLDIPSNIAPFITQTAIGKREFLSVFGDDYNTPDGTGIRDYIHVVDLAKAHVKSIDRLLSNQNEAQVEIFNLGTGKGTSVLELIKAFEKVSGEKLNFQIAPRRPGDIASLYTATDLANEKLNWQAKLTIEDAMLSAWNWEQNIKKQ